MGVSGMVTTAGIPDRSKTRSIGQKRGAERQERPRSNGNSDPERVECGSDMGMRNQKRWT